MTLAHPSRPTPMSTCRVSSRSPPLVVAISSDAEPSAFRVKNWRRVLLGFDLAFALALSAFEMPLFLLLRGLVLLVFDFWMGSGWIFCVFSLSCLSSRANSDCCFSLEGLSCLLFARLGCASSLPAHCTWFVRLRTRPKADEDFAKKNEI